MVKNATGGGGAKGLARKHQTQGDSSKLRLPVDVLEQFACITQMLGNGMCRVITNDNVTLIGHIRNKFRGRQKRHNMLSASMIVLVGLHDWETDPKNCDILTIYDDNQIEQLRMNPSINVRYAISLRDNKMNENSSKSMVGDVKFETDTSEWEAMEQDQPIKSNEDKFELAETEEVAFEDI